jgi:hypothetical protein
MNGVTKVSRESKKVEKCLFLRRGSLCYSGCAEGKEETVKRIQVNVAVSDPELGRAIVRGMSAKSGRMLFRQLQAEEGNNEAADESFSITGDIEVNDDDLWISDQEFVYKRYSSACLYVSLSDELQIPEWRRDEPGNCGRKMEKNLPPETLIAGRISHEQIHEDKGTDAGVPLNRDSLLSGLNLLWFQKTGRQAEYLFLQQTSVTAFFGISGGCGTTACALSTARLLHRIYGSKCLYISMKPVDDSGNYLRKDGSCSLLRLLYAFQRSRQEPILPYLNEEDGIWYFKGTERGLDEQVRLESMEKLFKELSRQGEFQHVIIDFGTSLTEEHMEMMQCCDAAVLVGKGERALRPLFQREWEDKLLNLLPNIALLHNMDDGRQDMASWDMSVNWTEESEAENREIEKRKGRKTYQLEDRKKDGQTQEEDQKMPACLPEFHVSVCEKAFIRMGGRWKIDLSGCFGAELSRLAVWIEEGDGSVLGGEEHEQKRE